MKTFVILFLFCFQTDSTLTEVIELPGTKDELYHRSMDWIVKTFAGSKNAIQFESIEEGKIVLEGWIPLSHKSMGLIYSGGRMKFIITLQFKDGRYKYELTDFRHYGAQGIPSFGTIEEMKAAPKRYKHYTEQYLSQIDQSVAAIVSDLKKSMEITSKDW